ncbi:MAG TPA: UDP-N-acetylmuramoyl-L-alanyl-D-glutamate--2,6-diaminopimelate ligase, partial [Anaerolineae bacterium]|nr:UDP-N-acetylmuramoyl-L-alanyl-D-glutamate--2,6-diaminopimelate ligase [Anaerolineae bacterium]
LVLSQVIMRLSDLISRLPRVCLDGDGHVQVSSIAADSRRVEPGALFVAVPGLTVDGHRFIGEAVARGAVAVAGQHARSKAAAIGGLPPFIPYVQVLDSRAALAQLAAVFYGYPARQLGVIGVTGTDGKTTTINLIHAVLTAAGRRTGTVSTVSARIGDEELDTGLHVTTPEAPQLQAYLARMVAAGVEFAVLEATSHGLHQHRVDACDFDVAVVTNVTHEHLDYHGSWEAYLQAKARLFQGLMTGVRKPGLPKLAVLNADDTSCPYLQRIPADRQIRYGIINTDADVQAVDVEASPDGLRFTALTPVGSLDFYSPLLGEFNLYNCLAAIAVGIGLGIEPEAIREGISAFRGVVGRMERIDRGQDFLAIVDFAHSPVALERALHTARSLAAPDGRVIVVFGSAGLRDVAKRGLMGEVAGRLADYTVITAEDPRTEPLEDIMAAIAEGCCQAGAQEGVDFCRIGDRAAAIEHAVMMAQTGDVVITCGKGHERSMCFGTTEYPWSDQEAMIDALAHRLRGQY